MIRAATISDAEVIAKIYNYYTKNTTITFEEDVVTADDMAQRVQEVHAGALPWIVIENAGAVVGYAYASKWKGRCAYRYSVETSVYIDPDAVGQGFGSSLYAALLDMLVDRSVHVVIGGIALPNPSSIALHEKFGFVKVAQFSEVGFKFDQWLDVGYWQRILQS